MPAPLPASTTESGTAGDPIVPTRSVLDDAIAVTRDLRAQLHDQFQLIALEAERAVGVFTNLVAVTVAIGVLWVITWLSLIGATVLWLISVGVAPASAMFTATALNLVAISILYRFVRRTRRDFRFPASLRALRPSARVDDGSTP